MKIEPLPLTETLSIAPRIPGDKSLAHRAAIFASLANGSSEIRRFPTGADNQSTLSVLRTLGVIMSFHEDDVQIQGRGIGGLCEPSAVLNCGNSGTTMRLMSGVLAGETGAFVLAGDASLSARPMARIIEPLRAMGAQIDGDQHGTRAPLSICGSTLQGITWESQIASAQVKSAILLAGLHAQGKTVVTEPIRSRDHSERMLQAMGAPIEFGSLRICLTPPSLNARTELLQPIHMDIPGDPSAAAFFISLFPLLAGSMDNLLVNPTRTGLLAILTQAGLQANYAHKRTATGEEIATCSWQRGCLRTALHPTAGQIVDAIDEFPLLCAIAAVTPGTHVLRHATELRTKESDRIEAMSSMLDAAGVAHENHPDGLTIHGQTRLRPFRIHARHDHRIAMTAVVLAILGRVAADIENAEVADVSFPGFYQELERLELAKCLP